MKRREFIKVSGLALAGVVMSRYGVGAVLPQYISGRPPVGQRRFISSAVVKLIFEISGHIQNPELRWMFTNCYPNTLDTTVNYNEGGLHPDTFVITGDIDAMWLRDSSAQVWPYLPLCKEDKMLARMIGGVIRRQTQCINIDPYANAFNREATGSPWASDITAMRPELHERKWEVDSLCYPIRLAYGYWKSTGDTTPFDKAWHQSVQATYNTFIEQQRKEGKGPYSFMRKTQKSEDTLPIWGGGNPVKPVGMICSLFRPSDDAAIFPFLVPSNLFAVVSLRQVAEMLEDIVQDNNLASQCRDLAQEVETALHQYAVVEHPVYGKMWAYEVDGFGGRVLMDDANVPSLLSLPYLGICSKQDPLYKNTRRFVWSHDNPHFFSGASGEGIGGPHVGRDYIWPMSIIMRGLTSDNKEEIGDCIKMLISTHGNTGFMHESFHQDDAANYTRSWFAWANTLFGELVNRVYHDYPELLLVL